jgi:hypothetical protein
MSNEKVTDDPESARSTIVLDNENDNNVASGNRVPLPVAPAVAPEGGVAGWLCIAGTFVAMIASFGFLNA